MFRSAAETDRNWRERGASLIAEALDAPSLVELLDQLPSVEPTLVFALLGTLAAEGDRRAIALLSDEPVVSPTSPLPIAHPLDFDWRFTADTNAVLIALIGSASTPGGVIVYLGAPTTWAAGRIALSDRRHVLFDRDPRRREVGPGIEVHSLDLLSESVPELGASVAVVDPPWYPEYHLAFLARAAQCVRRGGRIYASFPTEMTRPGVFAERANIVQKAERMGLSVVDQAFLRLRYETPPFERAAFAAAGIHAVPTAWRRGDMLTFTSKGANAFSPSAVTETEDWDVAMIRDIPLAVRREAGPAGQALIAETVNGATVPSVSRRDPARRNAVLWSSRNRVYLSSCPDALGAIVHALADGRDFVEAARYASADVREEEIQLAAKTIFELVDLERLEHGLV